MRKADAHSGHHTGGPTCVVRAEGVGGALQTPLLGGGGPHGFSLECWFSLVSRWWLRAMGTVGVSMGHGRLQCPRTILPVCPSFFQAP